MPDQLVKTTIDYTREPKILSDYRTQVAELINRRPENHRLQVGPIIAPSKKAPAKNRCLFSWSIEKPSTQGSGQKPRPAASRSMVSRSSARRNRFS